MDDFDWQLVSFDEPKKQTAEPDIKGACPKCGRHIGKGIHFHVKACDGHPAKAQ
ncbi:hypothetical protein [Rhizobium leguminosarum]|uniref:hypothetical protein n=1 Tax=Rhizobium leguminosarum TaxID=384 RepID=UPI001C953B19|nr:hypothetical protein [Rhizobium leguminosarum]MBY5821481.1 hypothetical protein [Rhizobium leguminosarum]